MHWWAQAEKLLILGCVCVCVCFLFCRRQSSAIFTRGMMSCRCTLTSVTSSSLSILSRISASTLLRSVTHQSQIVFVFFLQTQWKWWMDASHDAGSALVDTLFVGLVIVIIIILFLFTVTATIMAIVILVSATIWPPNFLLSQFKSTIFNLLNYSKHL